jgi:hypothetical protein
VSSLAVSQLQGGRIEGYGPGIRAVWIVHSVKVGWEAAMSNEDDEALSLGERLLAGVRNLWGETNRLTKIADHHGAEIENLKRRMNTLEKEVHGLKVSRGRAVAKNARLQSYLSEAVTKLDEIHDKLN